jgi:hypothetical protein
VKTPGKGHEIVTGQGVVFDIDREIPLDIEKERREDINEARSRPNIETMVG